MDYEEIQIRKKIEEAKKTKYCAKQQMAQADIQIGEYDLQLLELNKNKEETIAEEKPETIRHYSETIIRQAPIMVDIDEKTNRIVTEKGTMLECTIFELLKLKKLIPQTKKYPNNRALAKKMKWAATRTAYTSASIEYGFADEVFKIGNEKYNLALTFDEYGQLVL